MTWKKTLAQPKGTTRPIPGQVTLSQLEYNTLIKALNDALGGLRAISQGRTMNQPASLFATKRIEAISLIGSKGNIPK